ncbi:MAG TPA: sigma 54-interacting transcriptional regulator, partial [Pyrinomonadaceae bacterium]|nr:sigma 54-interacting transcriptional regulator [Pyrinomonadaceae bacterium]
MPGSLHKERGGGDARGNEPTGAPAQELEAARVLLDEGRSREAEARLSALVRSARREPEMLAQARCALSIVFQLQGRYHDSLEAVGPYEAAGAREALTPESRARVLAHLAAAHNYTGDHPKALALLESAAREAGEECPESLKGLVAGAVSRVYRNISEFAIARDHALRALEHYRAAGDWRGVAESYSGLAICDAGTGEYESALANLEQVLKLVGQRPAAHLIGQAYGNMAGICWFLKRPHDGIRYLEKAIDYYERTDHKTNAAVGYNNLGINLVLVGKWERAHEVLKRALALAFEADEHGRQVPTILSSVGELRMLRGDLDEALATLERAHELAKKNGAKWYIAQASRTHGRCHLVAGHAEQARELARDALALAESLGDKHAFCEAGLLLAEAHLDLGDEDDCAAQLREVRRRTTDSVADLLYAGETQRLSGLLALSKGDETKAAQHLGRSLSIFEMLGDRYRHARAHYELGLAHAPARPERAAERFTHAARVFRELGARLDAERAEAALLKLNLDAPRAPEPPPPAPQLLVARLAEAAVSRELLLRELAAAVVEETRARAVLVAEWDAEGAVRVVTSHGFAEDEPARFRQELERDATDEQRETWATDNNLALLPLRAPNTRPAALLLAPREAAVLPDGSPLDPLLRVAEMGLELCVLRERSRAARERRDPTSPEQQSVMPGFIHSSPAMTRLVDEVHKIRSSDVTVLVTGESGTGKELVARAIHALSSRRERVFVPFNCTAVPKELTEGYLFGYRRGAFTGAVQDSPGVIRTAAGGTLFLDEIGDLPTDVQPKLLRFLQEGEIQPLGEQRPQKVDVRIIAATNTDLERMVSEGRFREDLYYRLNVIRLRVPPLRERRSEIPTIVNYYINHYSAKFGRRDVRMTPQTVDLLMVSDWPGNVRQLTNEIQRIVARAEDGTVITPEHLSPDLRRTAPTSLGPSAVPSHGWNAGYAGPQDVSRQGLTLAAALAEVEQKM